MWNLFFCTGFHTRTRIVARLRTDIHQSLSALDVFRFSSTQLHVEEQGTTHTHHMLLAAQHTLSAGPLPHLILPYWVFARRSGQQPSAVQYETTVVSLACSWAFGCVWDPILPLALCLLHLLPPSMADWHSNYLHQQTTPSG